ncbi:RDD family protein [Dysgonomonas sp. OttesenSCG-928-D17]|nr:RDD family protein [Dysgonomonas sp. OttesenSCG-928-D17]
MENRFEKEMSLRTDKELVRIITIERDNYQPLALDAAKNELKKRNISDVDIEDMAQSLIEQMKKIIQLNTDMVGSGIRLVNFLIDSLIWLVIAFILTFPLNANEGGQMFIGYIVLFGTFILYYVFFETKYQKTPGKMLTKTKVVSTEGEKPTSADIFVRTLLRLITPFDVVSFLFSKNGLHDRLSRTKVIKADKDIDIA